MKISANLQTVQADNIIDVKYGCVDDTNHDVYGWGRCVDDINHDVYDWGRCDYDWGHCDYDWGRCDYDQSRCVYDWGHRVLNIRPVYALINYRFVFKSIIWVTLEINSILKPFKLAIRSYC